MSILAYFYIIWYTKRLRGVEKDIFCAARKWTLFSSSSWYSDEVKASLAVVGSVSHIYIYIYLRRRPDVT